MHRIYALRILKQVNNHKHGDMTQYTFIINETRFVVDAPTIESARMKVARLMGVDKGELNKMNPEIFEQ